METKAARRNVLVVDDKPENLKILTNLLKGACRVMAATNGPKALEIAGSEHKPDLILLDVMMPDMDGREVCRKLKLDPCTRDIPVIFITAMSEAEDEALGFELGAVDYITKPFNPTIVEARVRTHLELKEKNEIIKREREELRVAHEKLSQAMSQLQGDIQVAAGIQKAMLPQEDVRLPEALTIVTRFCPEMAVGGDFFDYRALDERHVALILADVSGHGLQGAFVTGLIKTSFELGGETRVRPADFGLKLNDILNRLTPSSSFATVIYCVYDVAERRLTYLNGGHAPLPILVLPDGTVGPLSKKSNMALGVIEMDELETEEFVMQPSAKLLVTTDGLVDAVGPDGERFGCERLLEVLREHAKASAAELDGAVFGTLTNFTRGAAQPDDIAVLTVEFH